MQLRVEFLPLASFLCLFLRERECVSREGERERETESEAGSRLRAVGTKPDVGFEPMNHKIVTQAEVRHLTDRATRRPTSYLL